jgi:glycosyltransferase involved in cell wall biosynthesis
MLGKHNPNDSKAMTNIKNTSFAPNAVTMIPEIAIIVPAYGVAHLLAEALDSLLAQDFQNWEAVVIDDGAPDDVASAVRPYLSDPRIHFLATQNHGVSAARNHAIAHTQAPLIALLDGDDLFRPTYLTEMVTAMQADPVATIITCNARIFGVVPKEALVVAAGYPMADTGTALDIMQGTFNIYIGSTFRRAGWQAIGGFDTGMTHAEDLDFWVRLLLPGGHARYINKVLGDYRVRGNSASSNNLALIKGRIRLLDKIITDFPDSAESAYALKRLANEHGKYKLEEAITQIISGDIEYGLPALIAQRGQLQGMIWQLSFMLWRVFPKLAPPMLAWRRKQHAHNVTSRDILNANAG